MKIRPRPQRDALLGFLFGGVVGLALAFLAAIALLLWLIVPRALNQVEAALGTLPIHAEQRARENAAFEATLE